MKFKKRNKCTLNERQYEELTQLQASNKNITFIQADKGGAMVILNTPDYVEMCEVFMRNQAGFHAIGMTESEILKEIHNKITKAQKLGFIEEAIAKNCIEKNKMIPGFTGLPKIHKAKEGRLYKVRPIINCMDKTIMLISELIREVT